jgi:hypothetical protein
MNIDDFYANIKAQDAFKSITNSDNFTDVPKEWIVIVSDIKGSTKAIDAGRYKEVNFVGAMAIIALLNLVKEVEIPFIFGGDGATILIPPRFKDSAIEVLLATQDHAKKAFDIELRVGMIEVDTLYQFGQHVEMTKLAVSPDYHQAIVRGGGLSYAENLIKDDENPTYQLQREDKEYFADFSGLECRWEDIPSPKMETLSLLIMAQDQNNSVVYEEIMQEMDTIFGKNSERHPINSNNLTLSFSLKKLLIEASLFSVGSLSKIPHLLREIVENMIGNWLIKRGRDGWGEYKSHVGTTTDVEKFDDMLRMIVASDEEERNRFSDYLESRYKNGKIYYGIHVTNRALMTCLVFERHGRQVHFVDAADGGYAMAAKQLKRQIKG